MMPPVVRHQGSQADGLAVARQALADAERRSGAWPAERVGSLYDPATGAAGQSRTPPEFFRKTNSDFHCRMLRGRKMIKSNDDDVLAPLRVEISGPELGKILGVTGRRVLQLADDGVIERGPGGGFERVASIQGYLRFLRDGRGEDIAEIVRREIDRALGKGRDQ